MSWIEGTIVEFGGDNPRHRELRKVKTHPNQDWNDQYFFHLSQARRAGYPDSALAGGCRIRFEADESEPGRPRVKSFPPYTAPQAATPVNGFLNPYHFIALRAPAPESLPKAASYLEEEPLHDRFAPAESATEEGLGPRYSGRLLCRVTTEGPVVVGSTQERPGGDAEAETTVAPFELPDPEAPEDESRRRPAIPGSTLRGLLSSLVEAASSSALRVLGDPTFTRRADLGKESLSAVGRLEEHGGTLRLRPLTLSLQEMTRQSAQDRRPPKERCRVFLKGYERKGNRTVARRGTFLERRRPASHSSSCQDFWYLDLDKTRWHGSRGLTLGLVTDEDPIPEAEWAGRPAAEKGRYTRGVLLVLGLDGSKADNLPPGKRYEQFLPFPEPAETTDAAAGTLRIPDEVFEEFRTLLKNSHELPRGGVVKDLPYLHKDRERPDKGPPEPAAGDLVYFETDPETRAPSRLSYSAVWRRPVQGTSLHQAVGLVAADLLPFQSGRERLTVAERMFGFVEADGPRALAGRVRVAHGLALGEAPEGGWYEGATTLKILASPKPPSPALYFGNHGYLEKRRLDLSEHPPQGRKVYLHHREPDVDGRSYETGEPDKKRNLKMRVTPLRKGTEFLAHLDFVNLAAEELGWLLYAARPTPEFRHKLGLGKPLGLGRVRIDPVAFAFLDRLGVYGRDGLFRDRYASVEALAEVPGPEELPPFIARRYREETKALTAGAARREPFPAFEDLHRAAREAVPEEVRWALELLGDPSRVSAEVTYPVLLGQGVEGEHFHWFVENDRRHKKPLPAIALGNSLPLLERYAEARRIKFSPAKGRVLRGRVAAAIQAIHVEPQGNAWVVRRAAPNAAWRECQSREEALAYAQELRDQAIRDQTSAEIILHEADA